MKVKSTVSRISLFLFFVLLTTAVPQTVFGQAAPATKSNAAQGYSNEQLNSKLMGREMPYRVIVPIEDRSSKARYPVLYLLHGLTGHFSNWTDKTKIVDYAARHKIIIVMPEGADGWYSDSVSVPNDKYESYIIKELIPEVDGKYRTIADRGHRIIAGLSMGGYGSLKFGLKYPETFSLIGSFSGALGAVNWTEKTAGPVARSIDLVFGLDMEGANRKSNDIFKMARELTPDTVKALPYVYISCGTEDFLIANNRDFLGILNEKKVPHEYREHPGIHDWIFWDDQIREFLDVAERMLKK